jgi:mycoredoxin
MKTIIALIIMLAMFQYWGQIKNTFSPPPDFSAMHPEGVVLYATPWCGYCKLARDFFIANKIAFVEYDIEASVEGRKQYNRLRGTGIPLLVIHGEVIAGYNPDKMKSLLNL